MLPIRKERFIDIFFINLLVRFRRILRFTNHNLTKYDCKPCHNANCTNWNIMNIIVSSSSLLFTSHYGSIINQYVNHSCTKNIFFISVRIKSIIKVEKRSYCKTGVEKKFKYQVMTNVRGKMDENKMYISLCKRD